MSILSKTLDALCFIDGPGQNHEMMGLFYHPYFRSRDHRDSLLSDFGFCIFLAFETGILCAILGINFKKEEKKKIFL